MLECGRMWQVESSGLVPFQADRTADNHGEIDVLLIGRVGARDERAVGELYDRHSRQLFNLIFRIVHDRGQAEDVLQEVFVALWTRVHTYEVKLGSPLAWLVRIARNRAIDRLRATGARTRAVEAVQPESVDWATPEDRASAGEQGRAVTTALDGLPREQRVLIEDAYFLGLTHSELASRHALPLGTVKTRIRSGLQAMRQSLGPVV
jgi:RNA polymerase sigma-70 factor (ECF subfamily)